MNKDLNLIELDFKGIIIKPFSLTFGLLIWCFSSFSQPLEIPLITNVSVDRASQKVSINWKMNNPAIVDGYIVFRQIFGQAGVVDGTFNPVATINNPNQFNYLDTGTDYGLADPTTGIENYRVASFKTVVGITEYSNMSEASSTFYLFPVDFNLCLEQNTLKWTSFHGFGINLTGYRIYYSVTQFGTPVFLADQTSNDTTFIHDNVNANSTYFYYVEAYSSVLQDSSLTNVQSVTTTMPAVPLVMDANYATVELYNQVELSFTVDANAVVKSYKLLKSNEKDGIFDTIASYPGGTSSINYTDFIKTSQEVYYYKVVAINSCGLESRGSNIAHNIVLEASPGQASDHINILGWNLYEGWSGIAMNYTIYRSIDDGVYEEITSLTDPAVGSYTDDISQWILPEINGQASKGHFCYYIVANGALAAPAGSQFESKSNISCAHQETIAFIPNAFNPNSQTEENRTFKPVITFVNDYKLIIYNRSGEIVFQSADPLMGWDGRIKGGELLKRGTYVYYLKYRTKDNKLVEKSGQINLVY